MKLVSQMGLMLFEYRLTYLSVIAYSLTRSALNSFPIAEHCEQRCKENVIHLFKQTVSNK
jgi:hypothetical protein